METYILKDDEALLLKALESHKDVDGTERKAGDRWMVYGPQRYIPGVEVELIEKRTSYALDSNEGIYVRDTKNGSVRSIRGQTYMLEAHEELWDMDLDETVEKLLGFNREGRKHEMVTFKCPFNAAVQVYNYKSK